MFERFTHKARATVVEAQSEARRTRTHYIGTEHLLMGLIGIGEGQAFEALRGAGVTLEYVRAETARLVGGAPGSLGNDDADALKTIGIDLDAVVESVERSFGPGALSDAESGRPSPGHIPFTKRAKKVLELSLREALRLKHNYIGTEHILLGLIREGEGLGSKVLANAGVDISAMVSSLGAQLDASAFRLELFSPAAREVVRVAEYEAARANLPLVGTEHILLALAASGSGPAYAVLDACGLGETRIRKEIASSKPSLVARIKDRRRSHGEPALSALASAVLDLAPAEALRLGNKEVDTEHLLLGIIRKGDGLAVQILSRTGISLEQLRANVIAELGSPPEAAA